MHELTPEAREFTHQQILEKLTPTIAQQNRNCYLNSTLLSSRCSANRPPRIQNIYVNKQRLP